MKRILIIGSGGREHSLAGKIRKDNPTTKIFAIPGNPGIQTIGQCCPGITEISSMIQFAQERSADLTIVGPEMPLSKGIVNMFQDEGLAIFGPTKEASKIEWSKAWAKRFMQSNNIPTAPFQIFDSPNQAMFYVMKLSNTEFPIVIKANGLMAGKGVQVCYTFEEAENFIKSLASLTGADEIIVEEFIEGEEASFIIFTDGKTILPLASSQDHKPVFDDDKGPNTGGMGAYSPTPIITEAIYEKIMQQIMIPTMQGMASLKIQYKGILYAGLKITDNDEPIVLEFNARLGDPETQAQLVRLKTNLSYVMQKTLEEKLHEVRLEWDPRPATCLVLASEGYPGSPITGREIYGLERITEAYPNGDVVVFQAGTRTGESGELLTSGGRVLGITALGKTLSASVVKAYSVKDGITFKGKHCRGDIGRKGIVNLQIPWQATGTPVTI